MGGDPQGTDSWEHKLGSGFRLQAYCVVLGLFPSLSGLKISVSTTSTG